MNDTAKFTSEGKAKDYYGNTIVSFVNQPEMQIYREAVRAQEIMKKKAFGKKLAFLPEDSLHITVLSLTREIDRDTEYWSPYVDRTDDFHKVDRKMYEMVKDIPVPEGVMMEIDECNLNKIVVKPVDEESAQKLLDYRDTVSNLVGVRHPWHVGFRYHVSLDYVFQTLSEEEKKEADRTCEELTAYLKKTVRPFLLPKAQFVIFNNMLHYDTDLSTRGNLF